MSVYFDPDGKVCADAGEALQSHQGVTDGEGEQSPKSRLRAEAPAFVPSFGAAPVTPPPMLAAPTLNAGMLLRAGFPQLPVAALTPQQQLAVAQMAADPVRRQLQQHAALQQLLALGAANGAGLNGGPQGAPPPPPPPPPPPDSETNVVSLMMQASAHIGRSVTVGQPAETRDAEVLSDAFSPTARKVEVIERSSEGGFDLRNLERMLHDGDAGDDEDISTANSPQSGGGLGGPAGVDLRQLQSILAKSHREARRSPQPVAATKPVAAPKTRDIDPRPRWEQRRPAPPAAPPPEAAGSPVPPRPEEGYGGYGVPLPVRRPQKKQTMRLDDADTRPSGRGKGWAGRGGHTRRRGA